MKKTIKQKGTDNVETIEECTTEEYKIKNNSGIKESLIWAACVVISIYLLCRIWYK